MNQPLALLDLEPESLEMVREFLKTQVERGLKRDRQEIAAIPAWTPPPPSDLVGPALVLDVGGTNMRAAWVDLQPGGRSEIVAGPIKETVPDGRDGASIDGRVFFDAQADLARRLRVPADLPVGYCFSYPARVLPDGDAILYRWTKGIRITGVEGSRVGQALREALDRAGLRPGPVRVLNDTVAALMAGARVAAAEDRPETIGLIVGTGTNMATFLPVDAIGKLEELPASFPWNRMAVNLESGNFHPPHLAQWDEEVDDVTDPVGRQRFEKAVSGYYLPMVFRRIVPDLPEDTDTRRMGEMRGGSDFPSRVAAALLDRSADLVAAALAGLIDVLPEGQRVAILAEGSLVTHAPGYRDRVQSTLDRLLQAPGRAVLRQTAEANLVGAACAARIGP